GALFFDELAHEAHLLRSEPEIALPELVVAGPAHAHRLPRLTRPPPRPPPLIPSPAHHPPPPHRPHVLQPPTLRVALPHP
ncbi:hypothetical protein B1218_33760, partial [Pseudomonas ogarae]